MASICIIAEHKKGCLKKATLNCLSFGREASKKTGSDLHLLVIGHGLDGIVNELKNYGAATIHQADDPSLEHYTAETWAHVTAEVAKQIDAKIVCMPSGTTGKDMMPRVAALLGAGMASSVLGFDGSCFSREVWAGSAVATVEVMTDVSVVTVQTTAYPAAGPSGATSEVVSVALNLPDTRTRFIELKEVVSKRRELTEARVIISGGRGFKTADNFRMIEQVADILDASVGATRTAVDNGWVTNDLQIGQTGKVVAPDLYMAIGLSGAMQHMAGMKNSKVIVAINKDEDAPIFQIADYGLVADLFKVLPELTETLKKEVN